MSLSMTYEIAEYTCEVCHVIISANSINNDRSLVLLQDYVFDVLHHYFCLYSRYSEKAYWRIK